VNSPSELRQKFLAGAKEFLSQYMALAQGTGVMACPDKTVRDNVWKTISEIILKADDPLSLKGLGEGEITEQVDTVLLGVANGELTIQQGKRLIELLQAGFEIKELPHLMERFAELDAKQPTRY